MLSRQDFYMYVVWRNRNDHLIFLASIFCLHSHVFPMNVVCNLVQTSFDSQVVIENRSIVDVEHSRTHVVVRQSSLVH